jgi:hypothetical protein
VKAQTGKVWREWFRYLDEAGAKKRDHRGIVKILHQEAKVKAWWSQMVAVAYEHERGLRDPHQKCTGEYSASGSRTLAVPVAQAYAAWANGVQRKKWLGAAAMDISAQTENRSIRAAWDGNKSRVSVMFYPKGPEKTQVVVDHMKLADSSECAKMKDYWFAALDRLQKELGA